MVRDSELLELAEEVYNNHDLENGQISASLQHSQTTWFILSQIEENGFYGESYYRRRSDSGSYDIVVALRGTDTNDDHFRENIRVKQWGTPQYKSTQKLMNDTLQKIDKQGLKVNSLYITGHSLGGKLAQQLFYDYYRDESLRKKYKITEAVVFNSAPPRNTIKHVMESELPDVAKPYVDRAHRIPIHEKDVGVHNLPVRNYVIEGEILNETIIHDLPGLIAGQDARSFHFGKTYLLPFLSPVGAEDTLVGRHNAWDTFKKYYFDKNGSLSVDYVQGTAGDDVFVGRGGKRVTCFTSGGGNDIFKYFRESGSYVIKEGGRRGPGASLIQIYGYGLQDISFIVYKAGDSLCMEIYFEGDKSKLIKFEDIGRNGNKLQAIAIYHNKQQYSISVRNLFEYYYSMPSKNNKKLRFNKELSMSQLPPDVLYKIPDLPVKDNKNKKEVKVSSASGEKLSYVVAGATMQCNCGNLPRKLKASYSHGVYIKDKAKLNVMDYRPNENIAPFGMCSSPGNPQVVKEGRPVPCKPIVTTPWIYGKEDVLVENYPALLHISQNSCLHKGLISFVDNGQVEKR